MATNDKYDRQLRLWGAKGQRALGETRVVLVGASATGTETLKNLVLPGIGSFSIIDDEIVTKHDSASNFFVPEIGKSRAEAALQYLLELNPDVTGTFQNLPQHSLVADWEEVIYKDTPHRKILVIASDQETRVIAALSQLCTKGGHPLLVVQSYGLVGIVRMQLPGQIALLDPKPTNLNPDLRLRSSFPALDKMAQAIDLEKLESHQHGHVPYPIILYQSLQTWRASHGGNYPKSLAEKGEFQAFVKSRRWNENEMNFEEAVQNAYLAYSEKEVTIPDDLDLSTKMGKLYQGLRKFMDEYGGRAPLNGSIPDMTASTEWYVQLQGIYKEQAEKDLEAMKGLCPDVPEEDIASFCANVFLVEEIQTRSIAEEFQNPPDEELLDDLRMGLMDSYEVPEHTPLLWYLGVRACQLFYEQFQRYPGSIDDWKSDIPLLQDSWKEVVEHYRLGGQDLVKSSEASICQELTRYANAEIHNVASVVGGVASQEAVKIITGQYIPLDNTYVFNGLATVAGVYKF